LTRACIAAVFFVNGFVFASWVPHIPAVMNRHDLSTGQLGAVLLAMAIGAMLALPLAGSIVARFGSRATTAFCALGLCLVLPLPVLAPTAWLAAAALFVFGILNATLDVAMNAQGAELEHRIARPIMSSFHGCFSLGGLAGAGSAGALLEWGMPPNVHVLSIAALSAAVVIAVSRGLLPSPSARGDIKPKFVFPSRALLGLGMLTFSALLIEGAMADWSAVFLQRVRGLDAGGAALGFAAFSLTMAAARFAGDTLARASALLALIGLVLALYVPLPGLSIAGFGLVGFGMANLIPLLFSAAARAPPGDPGAGIAAVATTGYLGFIAGPPIIGLIADWTGLTAALSLLVLLCIGIFAASRAVKPQP
jgi:hypothetical protein